MAPEDISLLNEACQIFEAKLRGKYPGQTDEQAYQSFLHDMQEMNIPPVFFTASDSKALLSRMKQSGTFDKIWAKLSSLETYDDAGGPEAGAQDDFDPYCTSPKGTYLGCVAAKNTNKVIADYLETVMSAPGLAPSFAAGVFAEELGKRALTDDLTRLVIAVGFYYETALVLESGQ
jgi:hypothetical protein